MASVLSVQLGCHDVNTQLIFKKKVKSWMRALLGFSQDSLMVLQSLKSLGSYWVHNKEPRVRRP